jgi:hypothetical protein
MECKRTNGMSPPSCFLSSCARHLLFCRQAERITNQNNGQLNDFTWCRAQQELTIGLLIRLLRRRRVVSTLLLHRRSSVSSLHRRSTIPLCWLILVVHSREWFEIRRRCAFRRVDSYIVRFVSYKGFGKDGGAFGFTDGRFERGERVVHRVGRERAVNIEGQNEVSATKDLEGEHHQDSKGWESEPATTAILH